MAWSGLDQRSFPRIELKCEIWINDSKHSPIHATTENVGGGGVCVILKRALERFSEVTLKLAMTGQKNMLETKGRVVWIVRSTDPASKKKSYDTGIEFVALNAKDKEAILNLAKKAEGGSE
jgi:hypothetical protein